MLPDIYFIFPHSGHDSCVSIDPVLQAAYNWHDGYTNAALRMSEKLPNCRALVGPWSHNWPDTVVPGPNIAFMDECLRFWDEHLKGVTPGRDMDWAATPLVRWFHCDGVMRPGPSVTSWGPTSGPEIASVGSGRLQSPVEHVGW